ncbi:MAG: XRE family transcriptional regulator [Lachnospiraceae bacterium]|nr:XRE family transcriptional regulator [Lachnospiraceae bacterium]MDE6974931.1 XRE family transcriptional regulator [Lachnospiraceae bacterium]MDE7007517.1 XRE family transcriptional regulator [Lachnospiraceae bacterium]
MKAQELLVERINYFCKEKRMSYYALSYESAVPMTTLMHIIDKSTVNPGILTLGKLCEGFGITLKEFFDAPEFEDLGQFEW